MAVVTLAVLAGSPVAGAGAASVTGSLGGDAVQARARLRIDATGRIAEMTEQPPVAWRPTPDAVYLVGTAGGLTGDDQVALDVEVAAGAHLAVRSSAAGVVYTGTGTVHRTEATVGPEGSLDWRPEPVIVTAGAHHRQVATVRLAATACLDWTEVVVLGRHGEGPGRAELRLDCTLVGSPVADSPVADSPVADDCVLGADDPVVDPDVPLLRHHLSVGPGAPGWGGPAVLGPNRTIGLRLRAGPDLCPPRVLHGDGWAWMDLDGPGWVLTTVAPDLPTLLARMAEAG